MILFFVARMSCWKVCQPLRVEKQPCWVTCQLIFNRLLCNTHVEFHEDTTPVPHDLPNFFWKARTWHLKQDRWRIEIPISKTKQHMFRGSFFFWGGEYAIWGFPKMVGFPNNHGVFLLKMIIKRGVKWGYHHFSGNIPINFYLSNPVALPKHQFESEEPPVETSPKSCFSKGIPPKYYIYICLI